MHRCHEIRIHGRGGQGVQTVGTLIAQAYFSMGRFVQTFATYGGERRGAPVTSFVRAADAAVRRRCDVVNPDLVMLFEPAFLEDGSGLVGLRPGSTVILNTTRDPAEFTRFSQYRIATLDALGIARSRGLGRIVNTAMLGAYCRVTGGIPLEQMAVTLGQLVPQKRDENLAALQDAFAAVRTTGEVGVSA